ncbi:MAG: hypothetical protein PVJ36_03080 [Nitrospirota bacterium]|jgi:hypothetical protein
MNDTRYFRAIKNWLKGTLLIALLIALSSCASSQPVKKQSIALETAEDGCALTASLEEESASMVLYQAKRYWDALSAYIIRETNAGRMSKRALDDFKIQNREFSKFYNNTLILYLRGDTSYEFGRSLVTIKTILLALKSSYPNMGEDISHVESMRDNCVFVEHLRDDAVRGYLNKIRIDWDEINVPMLGLQYRSQGPCRVLDEFELLRGKFNRHYNDAVLLYLGGKANDGRLEETLGGLGGLLSDAEQYPTGGAECLD